MEILGLMNWALIDIWEESQFINFRLSHMSENPEFCLRNTWMVPYDNLNMYWPPFSWSIYTLIEKNWLLIHFKTIFTTSE